MIHKNKTLLFLITLMVTLGSLSLLPITTKAADPGRIFLSRNLSDNSWTQSVYSTPTATGYDNSVLLSTKTLSPEEYAATIGNLGNKYPPSIDPNGNRVMTITDPADINKFLTAQQSYEATPEGQAAINAQAQRDAAAKTSPGTGSKVINFFIWLISFSFYFVSIIVGFLIYIASNAITFFFSANQLASSDIVKYGWAFTRDMLNFVFILVLLTISFSTIAGLDTFQMRKALPTLIFAALFVNFSLAIGGAFLQISNVMTMTIVGTVLKDSTKTPADAKNIGKTIATGLMTSGDIAKFYKYNDVQWLTWKQTDANGNETGAVNKMTFLEPTEEVTFDKAMTLSWQQYLQMAVNSALALVMICIFAVAFIFLAIIMVIRLVMLVILLILSPVPFVFSIIPKTKPYVDKWWSNFINYTFFLPVMTFFLALAIRILSKKQGTTPLANQFFENKELASGFGAIAGSIFDVVFISCFVFASILVAKALGIAGANAALGAAKKTTASAVRLGMAPAKLAAKGTAKGTAKIAVGAGGAAAGGLANMAGRGIAGKKAGGALATARNAMGSVRRGFGGSKIDEQIAAQQTALAGKSESDIKAACKNGNAGACAKLADSGDLDRKDFPAAMKTIPKNTAAWDKMQTARKKVDPVAAIMGDELSTKLSSTTPLSSADQVRVNEHKGKLAEAYKKMKPEDYAKLKGSDLKVARRAGVEMPMSKSQLNAVADSSNTELLNEASTLVDDLNKKSAASLNPGQTALLAHARKVGILTKPPTP
jgi:hypothetical protein